MRVDGATFLALTSAIAACHSVDPARSEVPSPTAPSASHPLAAPVAATELVTDAGAPFDAPSEETVQADADTASNEVAAYLDEIEHSGRCELQRFGPRSPGAEGSPVIVGPLASSCRPIENATLSSPCDEGAAMGCTSMVDALNVPVAQRLLACLRRKRGAEICDHAVVPQCTVAALGPVRPRPDAAAVCQAVVDECGKRSLKLSIDQCARVVTSMRKCHGIRQVLFAMSQSCSADAAFDDWPSGWSY